MTGNVEDILKGARSISERVVNQNVRSWTDTESAAREPTLIQAFQDGIARRRDQGYELESWQHNIVISGATVIESIVSVYKKIDP